MDYILQNIDSEFWHRVKACAAMQGISIKQLIINLLEKELNRDD